MKHLLPMLLTMLLFSCKEKKTAGLPSSDMLYTCSMHPQIMQDRPGKCPVCGMQLMAVEKAKGTHEDALMLSDQQIQLGNIKVDTIGKGEIGNETSLTATLNADETRSTSVSARVAGRIGKLYFKSQGDYVAKGARLYDLYSEELNNAKQQYILALEKQAALDSSVIDFRQLVGAAKNKLRLWGMNEADIGELEKTKRAPLLTSFYSPGSGYVSTLEGHEGDYVAEGGMILRLANLSTLWAEAQVYTSEIARIDPRGTAVVRLPAIGKEFAGPVQFVNPEVDPRSRINLIRIVIPNPGNQLKPGMPAYVVIKSQRRRALTLPGEAVIRGERMNMVWKRIEKNSFKSVMVETGQESNGQIEITSGLQSGDVVVTSGAYLLNSEYIFRKGSNPMLSKSPQ